MAYIDVVDVVDSIGQRAYGGHRMVRCSNPTGDVER